MFEVGFSEILLISVLALVVLGPKKLPRLAAQLGRWIGRGRAMARQFRDQLEREADLEDITGLSRPSSTWERPSPTPETATPIDSNDTGHADLSENPAPDDSATQAAPVSPEAKPTHE